ncbi:MAG: phosphatidate cytidylyltransferase [Pseudomonadota bacterium]
MLLSRTITAVILIIIVIVGIVYLSPFYFAIVNALFMLAAAWEWSCLAGLKKKTSRCAYLIVIALLFYVVTYLPSWLVFIIAGLWWLVAIFLFINYPKLSTWWSNKTGIICGMGIVSIVPAWLALNTIHHAEHGVIHLLLLLLIVGLADSSAYFSGRYLGKHKLLPAVSPGKTWQGVAGALLSTIIIVILVTSTLHTDIVQKQWWQILIIYLATTLASIVGDLLESMLKRSAGLKDSGQLLPGHGGMLDRVDGLLAAAPIFALLLLFL